jgi:hypothetical protein
MEIPKCLCDEIALESMIESYFGLKKELEHPHWRIFVRDKQEDKALIQAHLDAFKLVIGYYGGKVE